MSPSGQIPIGFVRRLAGVSRLIGVVVTMQFAWNGQLSGLAPREVLSTTPLRLQGAPTADPRPRVKYGVTAGTVTRDGLYMAPPAGDSTFLTVQSGSLTSRIPIVVVGARAGGGRGGDHGQNGLWLDEDFSRYTSIENYRSNPFGWTANPPPWFTQNRMSFTSPGYNGAARALTYNWSGDRPPGRQCHKSITITTSYKMPNAREVWIEAVHKFAPNFNTNVKRIGGNCSEGEYKFLLMWLPAGGRFDLKNGHNGREWWSSHPQTAPAGPPPNCSGVGFDCKLGYGPGQAGLLRNVPGTLWDGQWHTYRIHVRLPEKRGDNDLIFRIWIDNALVRDISGGTAIGTKGNWSNRFTELFLGGNSNSGTSEPTQTEWGRLRIWTSDPGWESSRSAR
jgi:hypothetical protein